MVEPFYGKEHYNCLISWLIHVRYLKKIAVKCNPDPVILRLLASLGSSFDCATMGEIGRLPSFSYLISPDLSGCSAFAFLNS